MIDVLDEYVLADQAVAGIARIDLAPLRLFLAGGQIDEALVALHVQVMAAARPDIAAVGVDENVPGMEIFDCAGGQYGGHGAGVYVLRGDVVHIERSGHVGGIAAVIAVFAQAQHHLSAVALARAADVENIAHGDVVDPVAVLVQQPDDGAHIRDGADVLDQYVVDVGIAPLDQLPRFVLRPGQRRQGDGIVAGFARYVPDQYVAAPHAQIDAVLIAPAGAGVLLVPRQLEADVRDHAVAREEQLNRPPALVADMQILDAEMAHIVQVNGDVHLDVRHAALQGGELVQSVGQAAVQQRVAPADDVYVGLLARLSAAQIAVRLAVAEHAGDHAVRHAQMGVVDHDRHMRGQENRLVDRPDGRLLLRVMARNNHLVQSRVVRSVDGGLYFAAVRSVIEIIGGKTALFHKDTS